MKKYDDGFTIVELLLIVVVLGLIFSVGWYVVNAKGRGPQDMPRTSQNVTTSNTTGARATANNTAETKPAPSPTMPIRYDITVIPPAGWTVTTRDSSAEVTNGAGTVTVSVVGGKGCEVDCKIETYDYTYDSQSFYEYKVTGYPNNSVYFDVIQFKDTAKLDEWFKDKTHTKVSAVSYPKEKRDYYLPIFTKIWLTSSAKPVY